MKQNRTGISGERLETCLAALEERFSPSRESTIPMLQAVQAELEYLPPEAMQRIAAHVGLSDAAVMGIATFYAQFYFEAPGKHRVTICRGTACHVRGAGKLQDELSKSHGLQPGETSPDGMFTLETVACFGACALAPVTVVDEKVHRQQTPESMKTLLDSLEEEGT
ncbi:MAG: NAD(P)H-dependent oxidoreductase subunit E [Longimicrobiales bacterium]